MLPLLAGYVSVPFTFNTLVNLNRRLTPKSPLYPPAGGYRGDFWLLLIRWVVALWLLLEILAPVRARLMTSAVFLHGTRHIDAHQRL